MRRHRTVNALIPKVTAGHLYYVKLKTEFGPLYKLGFTSRQTVHARFAFSDRGDDRLLDEVLLFAFHNDAFRMEQRLHAHFNSYKAFGNFSNNPALPLFKNGQSELYAVDILKLDDSFTDEQGRRTLANLSPILVTQKQKTPLWIVVVFTPLKWLFTGIGKLYKFAMRVRAADSEAEHMRHGEPSGHGGGRVPSKAEQDRKKELNALLSWINQNKTRQAANAYADSTPINNRLAHIVEKSVSEKNVSAFAAMKRDVQRATSATMHDPVLQFAASYALLIAYAGLYLAGHIDYDQFGEALPAYSSASKTIGKNILATMNAWEQFEELAILYGLELPTEITTELISAACQEQSYGASNTNSLTDAAVIAEANRRVALAAQ